MFKNFLQGIKDSFRTPDGSKPVSESNNTAKTDSPATQNNSHNSNKEPNGFQLIASLLGDGYRTVTQEFATARENFKDLRSANYKLGMKHLEQGNLSEAIFRFRLTIRFFPDLYDAYYQLAYCLVLNQKPLKAKAVLEDLIKKKPANLDPKVSELQQQIATMLNSK